MSIYKQGDTLRSLLENRELFAEPISKASVKTKDLDDADECIASHLAFLGPNIWGKTPASNLVDLSIDQYILDDLLSNDLLSEPTADLSSILSCNRVPNSSAGNLVTVESSLLQISENVTDKIPSSSSVGTRKRSSVKSYSPTRNTIIPEIVIQNSVGTPPASSFFPPPHELSQASEVSAFDDDYDDDDDTFDPSKRSFTEEELKVQPVLKKSQKVSVPDAMKDDKYWARRVKNNTAAKRSREARRVKENQITMRTAFLEKENAALKAELQKVLLENKTLKSRLEMCDHVLNC